MAMSMPAYHIWTPGDPVPDEIPEGCEYWNEAAEGWYESCDPPKGWALLRRWLVKEVENEQ